MTRKKPLKHVGGNEKWYRHILSPKEVAPQGQVTARLNPKFFENAFGCPTNPAWQHEISGRLLSQSGSITDTANATLARMKNPKKKFHGVLCASADDIRAIRPGDFDVKHTPYPWDEAHADLVSRRSLPTIEGLLSAEGTESLRRQIALIPVGDPNFPADNDGV